MHGDYVIPTYWDLESSRHPIDPCGSLDLSYLRVLWPGRGRARPSGRARGYRPGAGLTLIPSDARWREIRSRRSATEQGNRLKNKKCETHNNPHDDAPSILIEASLLPRPTDKRQPTHTSHHSAQRCSAGEHRTARPHTRSRRRGTTGKTEHANMEQRRSPGGTRSCANATAPNGPFGSACAASPVLCACWSLCGFTRHSVYL